MIFLKYLVILCLTAFSLSCNRFDNKFQLVEDESEALFYQFIQDFKEALENSLINQDIDNILTFYHQDYLNDGETIDDIELLFTGFAKTITENLVVTVSEKNFNHLIITFQLKDQTVDFFYERTEILRLEPDNFLFYGNREGTGDVINRKVLVELFTATWCPNCPYVESALYDLKVEFPDRFYYIEYHINDPIDIGNSDIFNYYSIGPMPTSVIQGTNLIAGGSQNSYAIYKNILKSYFGQESIVEFMNFEYNLSGDTVTGNIDLIIDESLYLDGIILKYALLDKISDYTNMANENCRNVVIARDSTAVNKHIFTHDFSIEPMVNYSDMKIIFWIQRIDIPYNSETSKVYDVIEFDI